MSAKAEKILDGALFITVARGAQILGLGREAMRSAVRAGNIAAVPIGRRLLVPRAEIERLLALANEGQRAA